MSPSPSILSKERPYASLRMALLPTLILGAMTRPAHAVEYLAALDPASPGAISFDDGFFPSGFGTKVDLSRFEKANTALPGTYRADIRANKEWKARADITLSDVPGKDSAMPCFDRASLAAYGIDLEKVDAAAAEPGSPLKAIPEVAFCGELGEYVPGAEAVFDVASQSLDITVPQLYTLANAKGYVDPKYWDEGVNAGAINYSANLYRNTVSGGRSRLSGYVGVDATASFGSWHLVHRSSFNWSEHNGRDYKTTANYLQHDVPKLMSQVYVGDFYTTGNLFDSVNLRGAGLASDDRMLPQSLRGYAPVVRGIAETNARVIIKQRGALLRELTVSPGPFEVSDLYPTGYGGDIEVEVLEADGRSKRFNIPFSATPQSLRAGQSRWEVAAGKVMEDRRKNTPLAAQGTYQRGLNDTVTAYGGVTLATGYGAALVGGALNTKVGAFSLDVTGAKAKVRGVPDQSGVSVRVAYSKSIVDTGTNFSLAAYRYSTEGFVGLNDLTYLRDAAKLGKESPLAFGRTRSQFTANVYQQLGSKGGQVFVSGARRDYWGEQRKQVDFTVGYSNQWKSLSYSLSAQRTLESASNIRLPGRPIGSSENVGRSSYRDTRFLVSASLPLGNSDRAPNVNAWLERSTLAPASAQVGISGTALDDGQLNYNANLSRSSGSTSFSASAQYNASHGSINAGYSQGNGYKQVNAGITGGLVLHGGGHTWAPTLGETLGLVHAPGAEGARIGGNRRSRVDSNGYAVVTNLVPYQLNRVSLDPKGSSLDVELQETSKNIAPRARSIVRLDYKTVSGRTVLVDGTMENGDPIPFGAEVYDEQGNHVGMAGQGGQIIIRGVDKPSDLAVRWSDKPSDSCKIRLELGPKETKSPGLERYSLSCSPSTTAIPGMH